MNLKKVVKFKLKAVSEDDSCSSVYKLYETHITKATNNITKQPQHILIYAFH
ncbi:hypothetical protein [Winogradskyella sp. PC D3.3]